MDPDFLTHLERLDAMAAALGTLPWIDPEEQGVIGRILLDFDAEYWTFVRYLSLPLYQELQGLLSNPGVEGWRQRPALAVVIPVHRPTENLLRAALRSLRQQVGVTIECLISVDGNREDLDLVHRLLGELGGEEEHWKVSVFFSEENRGVGQCRNRALREITSPCFTLLDDDDLFHPLRCLHGWLLMQLQGVPLVCTSWSRVSMSQKKIVLINNSLVNCGVNSFIAATDLLGSYGYMADLRYFEDTEYMQRLQFFKVPMLSSAMVGHYLHTEPDPEYASLASRWRQEVHPIEGHPYLCGSVIGGIDEECAGYEQSFRQRYQQALADGLARAFPGQ
jgi:Glycosyl transferase family 2